MIAIGVESIDFATALIRYAEAGGKYLQTWGIDRSNYLDAGNKGFSLFSGCKSFELCHNVTEARSGLNMSLD